MFIFSLLASISMCLDSVESLSSSNFDRGNNFGHGGGDGDVEEPVPQNPFQPSLMFQSLSTTERSLPTTETSSVGTSIPTVSQKRLAPDLDHHGNGAGGLKEPLPLNPS